MFEQFIKTVPLLLIEITKTVAHLKNGNYLFYFTCRNRNYE